MKRTMRFRFWLETGMATITGFLFVITLLWGDWIERVFGVSPDGGNGSLEWLIVVVLFVATITLILLARSELRKARSIAGYSS